MPNGKPTVREFLARIDERTINIENNLSNHLDSHKWFWLAILAVPVAIVAVVKLIEKAIQ
jgi:hypothetical protein